MRTRDCKDKSRVAVEPRIASDTEIMELNEKYGDCDANPSCEAMAHKVISRLLARLRQTATIGGNGAAETSPSALAEASDPAVRVDS